ncbi:hypothetical protein MKMG_00081 [Methanogenium sp. MK-MG]|nr:hypothetical protein MKMG_00081 [Methanogenium sp. MK-MG]
MVRRIVEYPLFSEGVAEYDSASAAFCCDNI